MRSQNLVENTGIILRRGTEFLGSCFFFRYPNVLLTAYHCVSAIPVEELTATFPGSRAQGQSFRVLRITPHPSADVAILLIEPPDEKEITWVLYNLFDDRSFGVDVLAFGFPQLWNEDQAVSTPRLFKGHVQRFFWNKSFLGYKYLAAELSFGCPAGLSGSAIVNGTHQGRLYGLVTENVRTTTELRAVEEVEENGVRYRESFHDYLNYGVALWLPSVQVWLDELVVPVSNDELVRRSENQHLWNAEQP